MSRSSLRSYSILGALLLMGLVSTLLTGGVFAQPDNLLNLAVQVSVNGVLAVGMTLIIMTGGIDLGVGSVLALIGVLAAKVFAIGGGFAAAVLVGILGGVLVGAWNGLFITRLGLPPFIVTLGTMTIARGLALVISHETALPIVSQTFYQLGNANLPRTMALALIAALGAYSVWSTLRAERRNWLNLGLTLAGLALAGWIMLSPTVDGLPMTVVIFMLVAAAGTFLLNRSRFGRYLRAIGGNPSAAALSGIDVRKNLLLDYVLMGALAAVAALLLASRLASGVPTAGNMGELDAIAAVVIGGTSLAGGSGTIGGTLAGAFIIGLLNNVLVLLNVQSNFQYIIKGVIIMGAVLLDVRKK
ncbi:MAG: ABC transporter permease subunit [Symbiobacteriia bacterium]